MYYITWFFRRFLSFVRGLLSCILHVITSKSCSIWPTLSCLHAVMPPSIGFYLIQVESWDNVTDIGTIKLCFFTKEAVMKKFHGSSVPRPRMKKQIPTKQPLWVERKRGIWQGGTGNRGELLRHNKFTTDSFLKKILIR